MGHLRTRRHPGLIVIAALPFIALAGQAAGRVKVRIVERRDSSTAVNYMHPGYVNANSTGNASCTAIGSTANCSGSSTTTGTYIPARTGTYDVQGATLAIELPDGRIAVVTCASKYQLKLDYANRRSCRVPATNEIEAEFSGDNAKLFWVVSLDGKKMESETYKIVSVTAQQPPAPASTSVTAPPATHP